MRKLNLTEYSAGDGQRLADEGKVPRQVNRKLLNTEGEP